MSDLLPCPWCRKLPEVGYSGRSCYCATTGCPLRSVAMTVEAWNRRAAAAPPPDRNDLLGGQGGRGPEAPGTQRHSEVAEQKDERWPRVLPPCDHDECPPTHCKESAPPAAPQPAADNSEGSSTVDDPDGSTQCHAGVVGRVGFLRFGPIPRRGYSMNHQPCVKADRHRDDPNRHEHCTRLAGVSTWLAAMVDGQLHVLTPVNKLAVSDLHWAVYGEKAPQWVTGELVGMGPVGEPLLVNCVPCAGPVPVPGTTVPNLGTAVAVVAAHPTTEEQP